ncbi:protein-tyrosine-phosphatase [Malassezia equina]|uniref:diphosphoinositol-polyphosphate diphosphatase n=1 Tax=Malassezia equina TaxID=1381935 RepID=A0AAF0IZI6_9BASI|nr:protein-tyrosine-phosphatase [Malassezia equina]
MDQPVGSGVPIDCTALLCRMPDVQAQIPAPPGHLQFLHRILREKAAPGSASDDTSAPRPSAYHEPDVAMGRTPSDIELAGEAELIPPDNFAMVNSWVYRSSFPKKKHFPFLKTLGLRSVLTLILEDYPEQNIQFLDENGIRFFQYGIPGNKEPFVQSTLLYLTPVPGETIAAALTTILDRRNHPMLIHCNKGKHRTGCLIGCLRKMQQWSLTTIFDEYRRFSFPKSRSMDQEFIELFGEKAVWSQVDPRWLPSWSVLGRLTRITDSTENREEEEPVRGM